MPADLMPQIKTFVGYFYYLLFRQEHSFRFNGQSYSCLHRWYNGAWRNERAVEVPIIWKVLRDAQAKRVLELGNVLSHYYHVGHDVVDKYERAQGVINQDILHFKAAEAYNLIISISTIEHIGWDEPEKDPTKISHVIDHLKGLLAPQGLLMVTAALGYNPNLDQMVRKSQFDFTSIAFMRKAAHPNLWAETNLDTLELDWPAFSNATAKAIMIAAYQKA